MVSAKMNTGSCSFPVICRSETGLGATERLLVYIDAGSYDAILDTSSYQGVFDEHATDFPVLPVDVVRPFDADVFGVVGQRFADRQCHGLGQDELPVGFHFTGMEEQPEQKILTGFRLPRVAGLSASGSLEVCRDQNHVFRRNRTIVFQEIDGGICRVESYPFKPWRIVQYVK